MTARRRPLLVTIDATTVAYERPTGIARYLEGVLPAIIRASRGTARFVLLAGRPIHAPAVRRLIDGRCVRAITGPPWVPSLYAWQQTAMAAQLWHLRPDVHFTPDGLLPPMAPCATVGTFQDIIWHRHPQTASAFIRWLFWMRQGPSLRAMARPLALSAFTRRELASLFGRAAASRVQVIPGTVDHAAFHPMTDADAEAHADWRRRLDVPGPFVLVVGNLMPHKNTAVAIEAWGLLAGRRHNPPVLLVVGAGDGGALRQRAAALVGPGLVRFAGYLADDDVRMAYRAATAFVFPSLIEGFGFPLLEAMASGTPAIHSGCGSLSEVAGDAGLDFDARDAASLAGAVERVLDDAELRAGMIRRGIERASSFSWEQAGRATWRALCEASDRDE